MQAGGHVCDENDLTEAEQECQGLRQGQKENSQAYRETKLTLHKMCMLQ